MWTISELKQRGKAAFKANYWRCVGAALILSLLLGSASVSSSSGSAGAEESGAASAAQKLADAFTSLPSERQAAILGILGGILSIGIIIRILLKIFLFNPLGVGAHGFFVENIRNTPASFDTIKLGFRNYGNVFLTLLLRDLFTLLWFLLFLIPGFIKVYSYRMVPYLLSENPDIRPGEAIRRSREMMNGNKMKAFLLDLSFFGWYILGALTLGLVNVFWAEPYRQNADAALYLELR